MCICQIYHINECGTECEIAYQSKITFECVIECQIYKINEEPNVKLYIKVKEDLNV